jgi:hypothetical protein
LVFPLSKLWAGRSTICTSVGLLHGLNFISWLKASNAAFRKTVRG